MSTHTALSSRVTPQTSLQTALRSDRPIDIAWLVGMVLVYALLDGGTRLLATVQPRYLDDPMLIVGAAQSRQLAYAAAASGFAVLAWRFRARLWNSWSELDHGQTLRWLAVLLLILLAWRGALYERNWLLGQDHLVDRGLLLGLAVCTIARPVFLVPFALQMRVIDSQFNYPFGTRSAQNIDDLLVIALLCVAAGHLVYVLSGRRQSSPIILLLSTAIAAHYFIPGVAKLTSGWITSNDISNLPLGSYSAGWLAGGNGEFATAMSDVLGAIGTVALMATLVVELGSAAAVTHFRVLRVWLMMAAGFHVVLFAATGFWFFDWIVLEIALAAILSMRRFAPWSRENATPMRGLIAVVLVALAGSFLFHPPRLLWLDSPVSYGYRFEATTVSGDRVTVPASSFAPLEQEVLFLQLGLGPRAPAAGGYGYVGSGETYVRLLDAGSVEELLGLEQARDQGQREASEQFMLLLFDDLNRGHSAWWSALAPPDHFWSSSVEPTLEPGEEITRLDTYLIRSFRTDDGPTTHRQLVLSIETAKTGLGTVVNR